MKKIKVLAFCLICGMSVSAQTVLNTGYLQITLNKNLLLGACNLDSSSNVIYIHSGAGYKSISSLWDVVVGNWGFPDSIGMMQTLSDTSFQICMDLTLTASNYYSTHPTDSGPLPIGSTIYNIGAVFRDQGPFPHNAQGGFALDNHLKGASNDNCSDVWLLGVNTDSIGMNVQPISIVEEFDGQTPVPAVTATWVSGCGTTGVHDISGQLFDYIKVFPDPFTDFVNIEFNMVPDVTQVQAQLYDVMGRKVADFTPYTKGGFNHFTWNGAGADGLNLPAGTYMLKVTNGSLIKTAKLVKL